MDFQMLHNYENSAKSLSTYIEDTLVIYYLFISHLPFIYLQFCGFRENCFNNFPIWFYALLSSAKVAI